MIFVTKYISYCDSSYVHNPLTMPHSSAALPLIFRVSYGTHLLDHLAADGAGFAGGQVAVVAVLEVDADLIGGLHLELVHGLLGLGDIDAVAGRIVAAHNRSLLFCSGSCRFPWEYFVPARGGYDWRVAAWDEKCGNAVLEPCLAGERRHLAFVFSAPVGVPVSLRRSFARPNFFITFTRPADLMRGAFFIGEKGDSRWKRGPFVRDTMVPQVAHPVCFDRNSYKFPGISPRKRPVSRRTALHMAVNAVLNISKW